MDLLSQLIIQVLGPLRGFGVWDVPSRENSYPCMTFASSDQQSHRDVALIAWARCVALACSELCHTSSKEFIKSTPLVSQAQRVQVPKYDGSRPQKPVWELHVRPATFTFRYLDPLGGTLRMMCAGTRQPHQSLRLRRLVEGSMVLGFGLNVSCNMRHSPSSL